MTFHLLTIFPHIFDSYINETILKRAQEADMIDIVIHNLRDYATDKHKTTDDTPTGGGPGMVMKAEPIYNCLLDIRTQQDKHFDIQNNAKNSPHNVFYRYDSPIILTSARGTQFTQSDACALSQNTSLCPSSRQYSVQARREDDIATSSLERGRRGVFPDTRHPIPEPCSLILICGRYEGVDQRVADHMIDHEYSIGPYVLSGGELPALVITEAIARLIPGVLGNEESLIEESYVGNKKQITNNKKQLFDIRNSSFVISKEYPQYTKPAIFSPIPDIEWATPDLLLSGNHAEIKKWRETQSKTSATAA